MNVDSIKEELSRLSMEQLVAARNIFEFNLSGLFIGDRDLIKQKLQLVNDEIHFRSVSH